MIQVFALFSVKFFNREISNFKRLEHVAKEKFYITVTKNNYPNTFKLFPFFGTLAQLLSKSKKVSYIIGGNDKQKYHITSNNFH